VSNDIATLGLAVDSRPVTTAKDELNKLVPAAKSAADAAEKLKQSTKAAGDELDKFGKAAQDATDKASGKGSGGKGGFEKGAKDAKDLATGTGLARHEMVNLSRQLQDVGVSLVSGQSPFTVLAQQGAQIADIFGSSKTGTVGGAFRQIVNFVGPMRLVALGVAGIATAGYMVSSALTTTLKTLDDVARTAGTTLGAIKGLQDNASIKGNIVGDDFQKGMAKFAQDVYEAKNNMGQLAEFLRANGQSAKTFEDAIAKVAELIKNARDDNERLVLLQRAGLPATMDWVRWLSQGGDAIRKAIQNGDEFNNGPAASMVKRAREFDEAWNSAVTNISNKFKGWLLDLDAATFSAIDKFKALAANTWGGGGDAPKRIAVTGGSTAPAPTATVDPEVIKRNISLQQQQLGVYGSTLTALEAVRQVELQVQQARLSGVSLDQKRIDVLKQLAAEQQIGVTSIKAQTDAMKIDAATVGMSASAATEYAAKQNALNEARRAGRELTPENIAQITREAAALGQAAAQADLLRSAYTGLVQGPLQTFTSAIANGATAWDAFKKAGQSALNSIASKLADIAAQNLWKSAFGGGGGGFNLGSLFGLGGGGGSPVMSGTGLGAGTGGLSFPMFADGTNSAPGGWSVVGENGPELMNVPRGAQILPNGVSPPNGGGGGTVDVRVSVDNDGNLKAYVAKVSRQEASSTVSGALASPGFVDRVSAASTKARMRRLG